MNHPVRILLLLLTLALTGGWQSPAFAGRLATVAGQANGQRLVDSQDFRLGEQTKIAINYDVKANGDKCDVHVRIYRQLPNGDWAPVNTPLRTSDGKQGSADVLLPAGDYRLEVSATDATFTVTVDK